MNEPYIPTSQRLPYLRKNLTSNFEVPVFQPTMDNDSGYLSHNHFDNSSENFNVKPDNTPIYFSEDALLEKPSDLSQSSSSLIEGSVASDRTHFSGLDDSYTSDVSLIIGAPKSIILEVNASETPVKSYKNPQDGATPDLFADEENEETQPVKMSTYKVQKEQFVTREDVKLLKNVQHSLEGVCPPPDLTICNIGVVQMLELIEKNRQLFCGVSGECKTLLVNGNKDKCVHEEWPKILNARFHGLHYNRSKISEEFERLCVRYGERHVGAETQSSCTTFEQQPSPSKRKNTKNRFLGAKSPGRRLSHLARRRITFSNPANMTSSASASSSASGSRARQILIDAKRINDVSNSAITATTTSGGGVIGGFKRALFQSPEKNVIDGVKRGTKRALFTSPCKRSPLKRSPYKRARLDVENHQQKDELSEVHKKKLQWAVYEALRAQNVAVVHPQFKTWAGALARVTRRLLAVARSEPGSTSERMLRIARRHSLAVTRGRTVDEIVNEQTKRVRSTVGARSQGYVPLEDKKNVMMPPPPTALGSGNKENVLRDRLNTMNGNERGDLPKTDMSRLDRIKKVIRFDENNR